jgi:hypothetical protein
LAIVRGNHKYLGGYVGPDDAAAAQWLYAKLNNLDPILDAITDPLIPASLAIRLAKLTHIPKPMYYARSLPMRVTREPLKRFDTSLRSAILQRLNIRTSPALFSPRSTALISMTQPDRRGGLGFRAYDIILPAAKWASAAAVAPDIHPLTALSPDLPCIIDRVTAHRELVGFGVQTVNDPSEVPADEKRPEGKFAVISFYKYLPSDPHTIHTHYSGDHHLPTLQRALSRQIEEARLSDHLQRRTCTALDESRLQSCQSPVSSLWLHANLPGRTPMSDQQVQTAVRLRLGLPAYDGSRPDQCWLCNSELDPTNTADTWHALWCNRLRRYSPTWRHDRAQNLILRFARDQDCGARRIPYDEHQLVPDGEIVTPDNTYLFDVSGIHPGAPSYRNLAPGVALARRQRYKENKYQTHAINLNAKFTGFAMDSWGSLSTGALELVNKIVKDSNSPYAGRVSPLAMSKDSFLTQLSLQWQADTATMLRQWLMEMRKHAIRHNIAPPSAEIATCTDLSDFVADPNPLTPDFPSQPSTPSSAPLSQQFST